MHDKGWINSTRPNRKEIRTHRLIWHRRKDYLVTWFKCTTAIDGNTNRFCTDILVSKLLCNLLFTSANLKGVMTREIKFALIFWHIRVSVHPKMNISLKSQNTLKVHHPQAIEDVDEFVSLSEQILINVPLHPFLTNGSSGKLRVCKKQIHN